MGRYLVEHGAVINNWNLNNVALAGNLPFVRCLVEHGAVANEWALEGAVSAGNLPLVQYLVEHGANINGRLNDNWTVLFRAVARKNMPIIQYLVERGADVNAEYTPGNLVNHGRQSLLFYAIADNDPRNVEIIQYLVGQGALPNYIGIVDNRGRSLLCQAVIRGDIEIIQCRVESGVHIDNTSLFAAIESDNFPIVQYLVEHGANVNPYPECPLHIAARIGHLEIVQYLVTHGARIDGSGYRNPLVEAATAGNENVVRYLVEHGAQASLEEATRVRIKQWPL